MPIIQPIPTIPQAVNQGNVISPPISVPLNSTRAIFQAVMNQSDADNPVIQGTLYCRVTHDNQIWEDFASVNFVCGKGDNNGNLPSPMPGFSFQIDQSILSVAIGVIPPPDILIGASIGFS